MKKILFKALLLAFSLFLLAQPVFAEPATPDINVFQPITVPGDGNYFEPGDIVRIDFNVKAHDVNSLATYDANIDINYNIAGTGGVVVNDLNLFSACSNVDINAASRLCSYSWTVPTTRDGNYYLDFNAYVILRTDGSVVDVNTTTKSNSFKIMEMDINVFQPITVPGDGNYFVGNQTVVIRWDVQARNVDGVTGPFDANIDLNWSATAGSFTRRIVKDLNLGSACAGDGNLMARRACTYTWVIPGDFNGQPDGNYFVDFNAKIYQLRTNDINTVRDFNATTSSRSFVLDNNGSTLTITSDNVSTSSKYTLTWTASDATGGIYYSTTVTGDSNTGYLPLALGTTSQVIQIGGAEHLPVVKTFCVKAQDRADNNVTKCVDVTFKSPTGGAPALPKCGDNKCNGKETAATCPLDCTPKCGDNACTHNESVETCPRDCAPTCGNKVCDAEETEQTCPKDCAPLGTEVRNVVLSRVIKQKPTAADIAAVLRAAGASPTAIEKASEAVGKVSVERNVVVEEVTVSGAGKSETKVTIVVTNTSETALKNVTVLENIPKSVAANASLVSSSLRFNVLVADPVLEFTVPSIAKGDKVELVYAINGAVPEDSLAEWFTPFATRAEASEAKKACSVDAGCNDASPCTADRCIDGVCSYANLPQGTGCGVGLVCFNGACVDESLAELPPRAPLIDPVVILVVIIIVLGAGYYVYSQYFRE